MTSTEVHLDQAPEFRLLRGMFAGDARGAADCFGGPIVIDAPRVGRIEGVDGLKSLVSQWPSLFNVAPGARLQTRFRTVGSGRAVSETLASVIGVDGQPVRLPIAIVGELDQRGKLTEARIYHYEKAITGKPGLRSSPFKKTPEERLGRPEDLPDVNGKYFEAVSNFDVDAAVGLFANGAYIEGGTWRIDTKPQIRRIYEFFLAGKEPMRLLFSATTYDGTHFALEWAAGHLATRDSGITVYDRNKDDKLTGMRMYDFFDLNDIPGLNPTAIQSR